MRSAARMMSGSCSTTRIVFPRSRRSCRILISRWCRGGAARSKARPARRACPPAASPAKSPAECAAPRRPKRRGKPVERQIFQPDVVQKAQALANFLQQLVRDRRLPAGVSFELRRRSALHLPPSCAQTSQMFLPLILTCRASARRRDPPQRRAQGVAAIAAEKDAHMQLVFLALQMVEEAANAAEICRRR